MANIESEAVAVEGAVLAFVRANAVKAAVIALVVGFVLGSIL